MYTIADPDCSLKNSTATEGVPIACFSTLIAPPLLAMFRLHIVIIHIIVIIAISAFLPVMNRSWGFPGNTKAVWYHGHASSTPLAVIKSPHIPPMVKPMSSAAAPCFQSMLSAPDRSAIRAMAQNECVAVLWGTLLSILFDIPGSSLPMVLLLLSISGSSALIAPIPRITGSTVLRIRLVASIPKVACVGPIIVKIVFMVSDERGCDRLV